MTTNRTPVTILTGFLGSGKTTLLNHILTAKHGMKIAVIENEFGEVGIDHDLVIGAEEEIFEMNNGCICCTVRGDLIRILGNLMKRRDKFDHILVETTGLADPGPVVQTFFVDEGIRENTFVNGVATVVDAHHIARHLGETHEAAAQIAFADTVILNKCDLVDAAALDEIEMRIRAVNALAKIHRTTRAAVDLPAVLEIGGFDLSRATDINPHFLDPEDHHHHHSDISSVGIESEGDCDGRRLNEWISELVRTRGQDIFRMKGVFSVKNQPDRVVFQGVHMLIDAASGGPWAGRPRKNSLVFIGRNLDREALNKGFAACLA
jgi:G3E family GTPase